MRCIIAKTRDLSIKSPNEILNQQNRRQRNGFTGITRNDRHDSEEQPGDQYVGNAGLVVMMTRFHMSLNVRSKLDHMVSSKKLK